MILASGSPRRHLLLREMGYAFEVCTAGVEELDDGSDPVFLVRENARRKAEAVAASYPQAMVLGADTTVAIDGAILNKPRDLGAARAMLRQLSGQTHQVFTGLALLGKARGFLRQEEVMSRVSFLTLDDARIEEYFSIVNPLDKAGAYGIQEGRELIISAVAGSLHNVMGLPTERLGEILREVGLRPEDE